MCMFLRTKLQVSSIIRTRFRQGVILAPPLPASKWNPKKLTQIRVKILNITHELLNNYLILIGTGRIY